MIDTGTYKYSIQRIKRQVERRQWKCVRSIWSESSPAYCCIWTRTAEQPQFSGRRKVEARAACLLGCLCPVQHLDADHRGTPVSGPQPPEGDTTIVRMRLIDNAKHIHSAIKAIGDSMHACKIECTWAWRHPARRHRRRRWAAPPAPSWSSRSPPLARDHGTPAGAYPSNGSILSHLFSYIHAGRLLPSSPPVLRKGCEGSPALDTADEEHQQAGDLAPVQAVDEDGVVGRVQTDLDSDRREESA